MARSCYQTAFPEEEAFRVTPAFSWEMLMGCGRKEPWEWEPVSFTRVVGGAGVWGLVPSTGQQSDAEKLGRDLWSAGRLQVAQTVKEAVVQEAKETTPEN